MALRTWARILPAAFGVAALAGAAQLGVAYGLGLVRVTGTFNVAVRDEWTTQLVWVSFFAMVAAVIGALAAGSLVRRGAGDRTDGRRLGVASRLSLAVASAVGAAVAVAPLTMQPARAAQVGGADPVLAVAICAGLGALVGVFAGYAALVHQVARRSFGTLITAVWVLGIASVVPSLARVEQAPAVRLGVVDVHLLPAAGRQWAALLVMPGLAVLAGAALGWVAGRRGHPLLTVALAGLPGPALLTLAYLIAGPGSDRYQLVPYWAAMVTTGAGVLGSVLAALVRRGEDGESAPVADPATEPVPATGPAAEPVPATGSVSEPVPATGPAAEPGPATGPATEPVPAAGSGGGSGPGER